MKGVVLVSSGRNTMPGINAHGDRMYGHGLYLMTKGNKVKIFEPRVYETIEQRNKSLMILANHLEVEIIIIEKDLNNEEENTGRIKR